MIYALAALAITAIYALCFFDLSAKNRDVRATDARCKALSAKIIADMDARHAEMMRELRS